MPDETRQESDLYLIGKVVAAHGLQGALRVLSLTDFPERFLTLKGCLCRKKNDEVTRVSVKRVKLTPKGAIIVIEGVDTREAAEAMVGAELCVTREERWPLEENMFYVSDLLNLAVVDESGVRVGEIADVTRGAQDLLHVRCVSGEVLVPLVDEWVGEINLEAGTVVVRNFTLLSNPEDTGTGS